MPTIGPVDRGPVVKPPWIDLQRAPAGAERPPQELPRCEAVRCRGPRSPGPSGSLSVISDVVTCTLTGEELFRLGVDSSS